MSGVNPVYTLAEITSFAEGLKKSYNFSVTLKNMKQLCLVRSLLSSSLFGSWGDLSLTKGNL
jgi:hypothetical protein